MAGDGYGHPTYHHVCVPYGLNLGNTKYAQPRFKNKPSNDCYYNVCVKNVQFVVCTL